MRASKKGLIGAIAGAVLCGVLMGFAGWELWQQSGDWEGLLLPLMGLPLGAVLGFGYAFGWPTARRWCARACGVAAVGSFFAILLSRNRTSGLLRALFFTIFCFSMALGLAYLPGICIGIRAIWREHRAA